MVLSQRVQIGLTTISFLLVIIISCFYLEIPTRIIGSFPQSENDDSTSPREELRGVLAETNDTAQIKTKWKLPRPIIDRVKTFAFFLGHPRSGHSIVASLMDSHPHMVISHEADVFTKISRGSLEPTKPDIFNAVWKNTRRSIIHGKRAESTDGKGYTLFVDGLYQGTYVDYIDVIGDKKAGMTTRMLANQPDKWANVFRTLTSLADNLKVIHVIRNPYDNIATMILYLFNSKKEFGDTKRSNQTYEVDSDTIEGEIEHYFKLYQAIVGARKTYNLDIIQVHGNDLISNPRGTLLRLCNELEVTCSDSYLEICGNKIFKTVSRTRNKIKWTNKQLQMIQQNIERFSSLRNYNYNSP